MSSQSARRGAARRSPVLALAVIGMAVTLVVVGLALGAPTLLRASGLRTDGGRPTINPSVFAPPTPTPVPSATGSGVIGAPSPATPTATAAQAKLAANLKALERKQQGVNAVLVIDPATGKPVVSENATRLMIPASNLKTLVALGVLEALDPDHTFSTLTKLNGRNQVVLVGGGDPYLSLNANPQLGGGPTLAQLADRTAAQLKTQGLTSVTLAVDETLFTGPNWNPTWPQNYRDQVTPISALMVDGGRVLDAKGAAVAGQPRATDAALDAGTRFADLLKKRGITVTGKPTKAKAATAAPQLGAVESLPLEVLVTHMMVHSDNTAAEMLLRHVGLAGRQPGSFVGGVAALQKTLTTLGVWQKGAVVHDGSGLSRSNLVSADMLGKAWLRILTHERVRGLLAATPVAGVTGTLRDRFFDPAATAGRGFVHAKTGTLSEVSTLSGWTVTRDGQPMVMVLMVNESKNDWFARIWIDQSASVITACGCR